MTEQQAKELREDFDAQFTVGFDIRADIESLYSYIEEKIDEARDEERTAIIIDHVDQTWGWKQLVVAVRHMIKTNYPLDMFTADSPMEGARFTAKLHEAMAMLDTTSINN